MVKIDREVEWDYGDFVSERLGSHVPRNKRPKKQTAVIEVTGGEKVEEEYRSFERGLEAYKEALKARRKVARYRSAVNRFRAIFIGLWVLVTLFLLIVATTLPCYGSCDDHNILNPREHQKNAFIFWLGATLLIITGGLTITPSSASPRLSFASLFPYIEPSEEELMLDVTRPVLPADIKITQKYKDVGEADRITNDRYYDEYERNVLRYKMETNCPICNSLIRFSKVRKPPFEDKCESCEYSFTFIYKKRTERYKTTSYGRRGGTKEKSHYIEYDGINPTRPRAPFKGEHISGAKRQPIPQDVKDKVWNRDEGKCTQCGSNENLEFDHIIPVSKGGANTYRNIQLLCEVCNREKSDNIG